MSAKYQGWSSYETWLINLWIDNEESSQRYWAERAAECYDDADHETHKERIENAAGPLADLLKDEFEHGMPELSGFWADLLNSALNEVDWRELAISMLEMIEP